jgi:hypothetical protein
MKVKSLLKLFERAMCRHPVISEPLEFRLNYRHRVWGLRASTTRVSHVCHCKKCGKMFGTYVEATSYGY